MSSEFIDIVLFGAIAIFLVYRLRSILGSSDGKIVNIRTKKNPQSKFKPKIVSKNDNSEFLEGANKAYEMIVQAYHCLLYTSPSPRDKSSSRMPSSA